LRTSSPPGQAPLTILARGEGVPSLRLLLLACARVLRVSARASREEETGVCGRAMIRRVLMNDSTSAQRSAHSVDRSSTNHDGLTYARVALRGRVARSARTASYATDLME